MTISLKGNKSNVKPPVSLLPGAALLVLLTEHLIAHNAGFLHQLLSLKALHKQLLLSPSFHVTLCILTQDVRLTGVRWQEYVSCAEVKTMISKHSESLFSPALQHNITGTENPALTAHRE